MKYALAALFVAGGLLLLVLSPRKPKLPTNMRTRWLEERLRGRRDDD